MPNRPPYYEQETNYSCAVACLRMVLESLGMVMSEAELRDKCQTDFMGTRFNLLVRAAKDLGFDKSQSATLSLEELQSELNRGFFPIVYIKDRLAENQPYQQHAVVVIEISESEVVTLDPFRGEYTFPLEDFARKWGAARWQAILIE